MPIGAFAQRCGLTTSALRFYADSGLLAPTEVDAVSGYRFYDQGQVEQAVLLRRLREIGMPLATVESVLAAGVDEAVHLIEEHVQKVLGEAAAAQQQATVIKASLTDGSKLVVATLSGPVFAAAIEQVLSATTYEPGMTVLNGVHFEFTPEGVTVTATDRYRLATRTLLPGEPMTMTRAATIDADDLRSGLPDIRRSLRITVAVTHHGLSVCLDGRSDQHCRQLPEPFPDHRLMFDGLSTVTTRITVDKTRLLRALEATSSGRVRVIVGRDEITVAEDRGERERGVRMPASVTGLDLDIRFDMTTFHPAISTAIGADLLLDLRGPDQPATIRSADHGDLTTLAMPTPPTHEA